MQNLMKKTVLIAAILTAVVLSGCLLVSGTFVIVKTFTFDTQNSFYHDPVDITTEGDWKSHKDEIDNIDLVGFELWINNKDSATSITFNAYLDSLRTTPYSTPGDVAAHATKVLDNLTVLPGKNHVSYGSSFKYLTNVDVLKKLVKGGTFDYYGTATPVTTHGFKVDSARIIVTFTGGK